MPDITALGKLFEFGITGAIIFVLVMLIFFLLRWVKSMADKTIEQAHNQVKEVTSVVVKNTEVQDKLVGAVEKLHNKLADIHFFIAKDRPVSQREHQ